MKTGLIPRVTLQDQENMKTFVISYVTCKFLIAHPAYDPSYTSKLTHKAARARDLVP